MQIGLGCVGLGTHRRLSEDVRLVNEAIDLGISVFDTADVYGRGASERVLGRAIRGRRDDIVVATKGGFVFRSRRPAEQWARRRANPVINVVRATRMAPKARRAASRSYAQQDFTSKHLRDAVHSSLRRLRTDRIDVYQLHAPTTVLPGLIDQLADLVTIGDIVRFGVGAETVAAADEWIGVSGIGVVQVPFGVLDPEAGVTTLPTARRQGCELWVSGVLGGGVLGQADRDPTALADHPKRARITELRRIAASAGLDQYQVAFGFVRAHLADLSTVIVSSTSCEHLRRNVEMSAAGPLSEDVLRALSNLALTSRDED